MELRCLVFLFILQYSTAKKTLPVFLIDYDNIMSEINIMANPFTEMEKKFFVEIIQDASNRSECVIIFTEDDLSTEDLSIKDNLGTPFYHLQRSLKQKKSVYIPAVAEPFALLHQTFPPKQTNVFHLGTSAKMNILQSDKYIYVHFQDNNELARSTALRKHDIIMKEVYFTVRQLKPGPIIGFYTGKSNPVEVKSLEYVPMRSNLKRPRYLGVMVATKAALFRLSGVYAATLTRRASFDQKPAVAERRTRRTLSTTMQYSDFELQFNFNFREKDWELENVVLLEGGEEVGRTRLAVAAPWNWSYFCAEPLMVVNSRDGSSITVSQYQIQPHYRMKLVADAEGDMTFKEPVHEKASDLAEGEMKPEEESEDDFGETVNCGPYFNAQILCGLIVAGLFLFVLMCGVLMLFHCKTNDRFEDPTGKPLLILAE